MANEGGKPLERAISFAMRLVVSLILPAWGVVMVALGAMRGEGWWIATGVVVFAIGAVLFAGSSLITALLGSRRLS
jgi:uncharacterized membrane protein YgdD (TMEM256/DUF423 family)